MGPVLTRNYDLYWNREVTPFPPDGLQFDPLYGFPDGRKEKVMKATEEEMISAAVPESKRDYCAHLFIEYKKCYRDEFPIIVNCAHKSHEYQDCLYKEMMDSYKDYERERRLLVRQKRIAKKKAKEEALME